MWDPNSVTRDQTHSPCVGRQSPNHRGSSYNNFKCSITYKNLVLHLKLMEYLKSAIPNYKCIFFPLKKKNEGSWKSTALTSVESESPRLRAGACFCALPSSSGCFSVLGLAGRKAISRGPQEGQVWEFWALRRLTRARPLALRPSGSALVLVVLHCPTAPAEFFYSWLLIRWNWVNTSIRESGFPNTDPSSSVTYSIGQFKSAVKTAVLVLESGRLTESYLAHLRSGESLAELGHKH